MKENQIRNSEGQEEQFGELIKFTASGFAAGLIAAVLFDLLGFQRNPVGQWIVRSLSGEGESILEGLYAIRKRLLGQIGSMAEAYGWGKLFGMMVPWLIDWGSRFLGVDVYGVVIGVKSFFDACYGLSYVERNVLNFAYRVSGRLLSCDESRIDWAGGFCLQV